MIKSASSSSPAGLLARMSSVADETRLRLLKLLERHELGVVELCDIVQLPQSTVSRHLKVLLDQKWVRSRSQGTTHLYRMILDELDAAARRLWVLAREQSEQWPTYRQDELRLERRLAQRQSDPGAFFASAAGQWDRIRTDLYGHAFLHAATLPLLSGDLVVADLGCGTGQLMVDIAPYVRKVIGIDNSAQMLKAARRRTNGLKNVALHRADLGSLPLNDASADAALMILALTYLQETVPALKEAHRILKPGGKFILLDLLAHDREEFRRQLGQRHLGFSPEMINLLLGEAGFGSIVVRALSPEPQAKGPALFVATAATNNQ